MNAAIELVDDLVTLQLHILRDPANYPTGPTMRALLAAIEAHDIPPPDALAKAVGHVLFVTAWHAQTRALTTDERAARGAASRLYNALYRLH